MGDALVAALEYPHPHLPYGLSAKPSKELRSLSGRDAAAQDAALPPVSIPGEAGSRQSPWDRLYNIELEANMETSESYKYSPLLHQFKTIYLTVSFLKICSFPKMFSPRQ